MGRTLYLMLAAPLLIFLFILPETSVKWNEHARFAVQVGCAILLWLIVFLRFSKIGVRRELSLLPSLPFLFFPIYHTLAERAGWGIEPHAIALLLLGASFIAGGVALVLSFVPDQHEPGTRRIDGITIMLTVFTAYFLLTECLSLIGLAFEG